MQTLIEYNNPETEVPGSETLFRGLATLQTTVARVVLVAKTKKLDAKENLTRQGNAVTRTFRVRDSMRS